MVRLKILNFDVTFLARVHDVQKCTFSNLKHNIKEELFNGVKIMQVEAIKAISSAAADSLISFFLFEMHLEQPLL